jgi:heme A synthase
VDPNLLRSVGAALLLLFTFRSGSALRRAGTPYRTAVLTAHKLAALVAAALAGFTFYSMSRAAPADPAALAAVWASAALFVAAVASGGVLSAAKASPAGVAVLHRVAPYLTVLAAGAAAYLLLGGGG